jgi:two-component system phosphate regulon sensor histidine kinase PhoR
MRTKIIWKFFGALVFLILLSVFIMHLFVSRRLGEHFENKMTESLRLNAQLVGDILKDDLRNGRYDLVQQAVSRVSGEINERITVIGPQGRVLADSERDPAVMENHSERQEVLDAMAYGFGHSTRMSDTLKHPMKYVAVCIEDNTHKLAVIRLAVPEAKVNLELHRIYTAVLAGALVAIVIALLMAYFISSSITLPILALRRAAYRITQGDLAHRVHIKSRDELGQLAQSLNTMAQTLQERMVDQQRLDRARTDFVANVSHELKTPLTLIKGYIETLEDRAMHDAQQARRFIRIISEHADRLGNLIDDLLSLGELESSKDSIERRPADLKKLADDVALGFGHALAKKGHTLSITTEGQDVTASVDADKMEQVLVNLIDNAVKYTPANGQIQIHLVDQGTSVQITVKDNGIGIAKEHVRRVFERFYRVDKARSRELGGTGLGLGIAKHIVLGHRGTIDIESQLGNGTAFIVTLPKS